jgi:hypothetical protein
MQQHCVGRLHLRVTWQQNSLAQLAWFAQYRPLVSSLHLDLDFDGFSRGLDLENIAGLQAITDGLAAALR